MGTKTHSSDDNAIRKKTRTIKRRRSGSTSLLEKININHHAPEDWQKIISPQKLQRLLETGNQIGVHVLVGDIRQSAFLMKESVSAKRFAQTTRDFIKAIKSAANANGGWFDRFTGDGFIIYWIYGDEPDKYVKRILAFCQALLTYFPEVMNEYRLNSRNFPAGVGLSLGVDSGLCSLVEIEDLNIVGPPVVGASRMVGAAKPFETLVNVSIGVELYKNRKQLAAEHRIHIVKKKIGTKEYAHEGGGQEAYSIQFKS